MGNQLVAFAPSLIRPVEHYLTDVPELQFDTNLGSTRFLKVCRAKHEDLPYVVKVFVIHEHTLPIQAHCDRLVSLRNALRSSRSSNCLPFTQIKTTERSVIVSRPYIKYSLYDRISTRPFIQWSEKLWIAFQLLYGMVQVHKHSLCHGDLKLENILISSGLRLVLCDFAPFKPVFLPRNNPSAIFGFFFDTAGRRCCYVAPERFRDDKTHLGADNLLAQEDELRHALMPSMDVFSAGCCLIELFTEGRVPFDLSQLLSFCAGEYDPSQIIQKIDNVYARELVAHMIQRDPSMRLSAEEYLNSYRGRLFPEVFYLTLQSYFDILAFQPLPSPDSRMFRLWQDIRNLPDDACLYLIFLSLVTAEVRGIRTVTAKLYALESFYSLSTKLSGECILERIVPYVIYLLNDDTSHRVRAQALETLVNCLDLVKVVPPSDNNIFSGYIFPALEKLDRDISMRIAMARNISKIAKISMRYLEVSFLRDPDCLWQHQPHFATELRSQRETVAMLLSTTLTDADPVVKKVLVSTDESLGTLCNFFGRTKSYDIILSHLITFLNDKDDSQLRILFFRCIPTVASFIGWQAAPLLIPLLKQGLSDVEEFVMREALLTIKILAEINYFSRKFLLELLEETLPFIIHPNLWLRNAAVGAISSIRNTLSQVDIHCHVIPRLKGYLKSSPIFMWGVNEVSILSIARPPFERQVYESCARAKGSLLQSTIDAVKCNDDTKIECDSYEVFNFITRLRAEGLPVTLDSVFLAFLQKHLVKVNTQRSLRLSTSTTGTAGALNGRGLLHGQQAPQSNFLILPMPPVGEINCTDGSSTFSATDHQHNNSRYSSAGAFSTLPSSQGYSPASVNFTEKPRGVLVAHLHEHRGPILKICQLPKFQGLFATCTREDVRIWDAEKMEGKNIANRSRCNIKLPGDRNVTNLAYAIGSNIIGVSDEKELFGFGLENMIARCAFSLPVAPHNDDAGAVVALESCSPYLFIVGTELGALIGFDTRAASREAFRLQSDLKYGLLSSLSSDDDHNWMCTATSKGILTCWDLRFSIPAKIIKTASPIRRIKTSPFQSWGVFTASRHQNEASLWNLETGSRDLCLWASPQPPLTKPAEVPVSPGQQPHSILGMTFVKSLNAVITGGSDMCVRWWDMSSPSDSYLLVSPDKAEQHISGIHKTSVYASRLVDGVEVIHDISGSKNGLHSCNVSGPPVTSPLVSDQINSASLTTHCSTGTINSAAMGNAHHNSISDIATVSTANQCFILTSSYDGVIKVWK